ncbi:MAG: GerMN domain-containing protein [Lachnospiraceae bacterium]|nr:GerMN domain-containing protein [Lachnospiraceae bacterium]
MKKVLVFILICALIFGSAGCRKAQKSDNSSGNSDVIKDIGAVDSNYKVYYLASDMMSIKGVNHAFQAATVDALIDECLSLLKAESADKTLICALNDFDIIGHEYSDISKILTLDFSAAYKDMLPTEEILVRAAIVKTFTQFDRVIDYVAFKVEGESLTDKDGKVLIMMNNDFVENTMADIKNINEYTFVLYYASSDNTQLVANGYNIHYNKAASKERVIIESLISGPVNTTLNSTLSSDTKLNSITTENGLCTVDLNSVFLTPHNEQDFSIKIFSIVNSLTELDSIDKVRFLINGQKSTYEEDGISLDTEFEANQDIVQKPIVPPAVDK